MALPDLPARHAGSHHDTVSMYCADGPAQRAYAAVKERLYAIDRWRELNDSIKTDFLLCGPEGEPSTRSPQRGDYIRIDLAGPGSPSGGGYDWVVITQIAEETGDQPWAAMTVKPSPPPGQDQGNVAHFYEGGATNTFVVRRVGQCILAEVHGRNEEPNVADAPLLDRLRNEAVALAGKLGFGKVQWKDWTDGMVSVIQTNPDGDTGFE
ncbi:hypothetical protein [Lewinella sp. IMCC34191]|uniref:hypothetical protein n=1 Tax=Lewinella sp. IMCC34191 TaxID=2259172 RepID=UPI000E22A54B|nr:hypothetical protein [Lewinella sp. IMCC34191]